MAHIKFFSSAVVVLVLTLGVVDAASLFGDKQCLNGPDFWCVSPKNADLCSAEGYCQAKVWGHQSTEAMVMGHQSTEAKVNKMLSISGLNLRESQSIDEKGEKEGGIVTCLLCKAVMSQLQHLIKKNSTRADIRKALKKVCSLVHSHKCKSFVDKYVDKLVDMIADHVPFSKICSSLNLCSTPQPQQETYEKKTGGDMRRSDNGIECIICTKVMSQLESVLKQKSTKDEIRQALEKICELVQSSECKTYVDKYSDVIVDYIQNNVPFNKICGYLKFCSSLEEWRPGMENEENEDSVGCIICQAVMSELSSLLKLNSTREEIREALEKVCDLVHSSECKSFVDEYVEEIIDYIEKDVPFDKICSYLQLCASQESIPTSGAQGRFVHPISREIV